MKLVDIEDMWERDSTIDPHDVVKENVRTGKLHSKYVRLLGAELSKFEEMKILFEALKQEKAEFYQNGSDEVWRAKGWEEWRGGKVLKTDLGRVIPQDKHIVEAATRLGEQKSKVDVLKEIIDHIGKRSYLLKNITAEKQYLAGR